MKIMNKQQRKIFSALFFAGMTLISLACLVIVSGIQGSVSLFFGNVPVSIILIGMYITGWLTGLIIVVNFIKRDRIL